MSLQALHTAKYFVCRKFWKVKGIRIFIHWQIRSRFGSINIIRDEKMLSKYKYCITGKLGRCPFSKVLMSHQRAHIEFWHRRLALSIVCESANPWVIGWQMIRSYRIFLSFPFSVQHFGNIRKCCYLLDFVRVIRRGVNVL